MTIDTGTEQDTLSLDELLGLVGDTDDLLKEAVERLRRERSGEMADWFKHGNHGSHNSG